MKRITVTWQETTTYAVSIVVPDDYPETLEEFASPEWSAYPPSGDGEEDWWARVEEQSPDWIRTGCIEVTDRTLTDLELDTGPESDHNPAEPPL